MAFLDRKMEKDFTYIEKDEVGIETLDILSSANKFNKWVYETIKPFCRGEILEIGSGIGNISKYFLEGEAKITLSDIRVNYCKYLEDNFKKYSSLREILNLDLVDPLFETKYINYFNKFDTVFALNVVEHIKNDKLAMKNAKKLLKPSGKLIVLVPAYNFLYNNFDKELYHYRRYNLRTLQSAFTMADLNIIKGFYFNCVGMLGWYVSGKLQGNKNIPKSQVSIYNKLVWFFRIADKIVMNKTGLSVIVVGEKTQDKS
jgi:2-polyprenyl-3-methyl-5-hydroxy-6-metoxy-1,4-benzoquinol methylase